MAKKNPASILLSRLDAIAADPRAPAARALLHDVLERGQGVVLARAASILARAATDASGRVDDDWTDEFQTGLADAFARCCDEPGRYDKGAAGKRAIADCLDAMESGDAAPFLRGVTFVQKEMRTDLTAPMRARCLAALVRLRHPDSLLLLADLLWDPADAARLDAARVAAYEGSLGAEALLRARLRAGDEAEVMAEVYAALLALGGERNVPLVAAALGDEILGDHAAAALGESRVRAGLDMLAAAWQDAVEWNDRRRAIFGIALHGGDEAMDLLASRLRNADPDECDRVFATLALAWGEESPRLRRLQEVRHR
ncbi:MAG: hypothetical protein LUE17_16580 [Planctomycetaceae bacterium]|nr:hypothetical protein [Planctomycetaceae bacterium]